jgi:hypothetical protein
MGSPTRATVSTRIGSRCRQPPARRVSWTVSTPGGQLRAVLLACFPLQTTPLSEAEARRSVSPDQTNLGALSAAWLQRAGAAIMSDDVHSIRSVCSRASRLPAGHSTRCRSLHTRRRMRPLEEGMGRRLRQLLSRQEIRLGSVSVRVRPADRGRHGRAVTREPVLRPGRYAAPGERARSISPAGSQRRGGAIERVYWQGSAGG